MKNINSIMFAVATCLAIIPTACNKTEIEYVKGGTEVQFSAGIERTELGETRANYGGYANRYTESSKTCEPIYWSEGDLITIYCSDGSTSMIEQSGVTDEPFKYRADYVVSEVCSDKTKAKIVLSSEMDPQIGLRWSDDELKNHTFYAVYPSYVEDGIQITRDYNDKGCIDKKTIYCSLASEQNTLSGGLTMSSDSNYTLVPDMKWMLMHAQASYTRSTFPSGEVVFLNFQPITTAIQFTIKNSTTSNLTIGKLELLSESPISQRFMIEDVTELASDGFPVVVANNGNNKGLVNKSKSISLPFDMNQPVLRSGKTITFTFFLAPIADVSDTNKLRLRITRTDGSTLTTHLRYTDGTYVKFSRCKKHFVTGIMVPEGVQWTIDYEPFLTDWISGGCEDVALN